MAIWSQKQNKKFWSLTSQVHNLFELPKTEDHRFSESHHHLHHKSTHDYAVNGKFFKRKTVQLSKPNVAVKFQNLNMPKKSTAYPQVTGQECLSQFDYLRLQHWTCIICWKSVKNWSPLSFRFLLSKEKMTQKQKFRTGIMTTNSPESDIAWLRKDSWTWKTT